MPVKINLAKLQGRVRDGVEKHWMKSLWSGEATSTTQKLQNLEVLLAARFKTFIKDQ